MPRMSGHEFLAKLRASSGISDTCVFVFTTSESQSDIMLAYRNRANGYIVKPDSTDELYNVINMLNQFWQTCKHPVGMNMSKGLASA